MSVSQEKMERMVINAALGLLAETVGLTPEERAVEKRVRREVAAIKSRPNALVELPPDIP